MSHAVVAVAVGTAFPRSRLPARTWALGAAVSMLPDADVVAFVYDIPYGDLYGHRGITHSLAFAAALAATLVGVVHLATGRRRAALRAEERRYGYRAHVQPTSLVALGLYLFLCTASHGVLDAMTTGGHGIAFFAPWDETRYFLPWRPIRVSPIGLEDFLSARGVTVLKSELVWVVLPCIALVVGSALVRRLRRDRPVGA